MTKKTLDNTVKNDLENNKDIHKKIFSDPKTNKISYYDKSKKNDEKEENVESTTKINTSKLNMNA